MPADVPLLGVNLGHVGFLAEAESWEIDQVVAHVVGRGWTMEERFVVEVVVRDRAARDGGQEIWRSFAVNEVSVEKADRERMVEVLIAVDDRPLHRWACDGVLVATPTGSTAYTFSAGGPVIWPELDALLLVPLSAHALFARPLVLGPKSTVTCQLIDTTPGNSGVVWCDGRRSVDLAAGMEIQVSAGSHRLRMARIGMAPFTDRLVRKFGLRVEGWRGAAEQRNNNGPDDTGSEQQP
jgi:NAD+ kinase